MVAKPEFAEFVAVLSAEDAQLQADLKSAEDATKRSATRMQASLDKVNVSAGNLSGVLGTVSQVGASVGGSFGGIVGQGVAATQALSAMASVVSGPTGLIVGLSALTVAVAFNREGIAEWARRMLASVGVIEDMDTALAEAEGRLKERQSVLEKQESVLASVNGRLADQKRLLQAVQTNNPEVIASTQRENALRRAIEQVRAAGGAQNAVDQVRKIFETQERILDTKRRQAEFDAKIANHAKERLARETKSAALQATQVAAARNLLVAIGAARPSQFIDDPILRRLAQLQEIATQRNAARQADPARGPSMSGVFTLSRITSPGGIIREGEVLGRQTLTIQEQIRRVTVDHRDISAEIRAILSEINERDKTATAAGGSTGSNALRVSGRA